MKYYFVAQIRVNDPEEYDKYLAGFDEAFSKYKGEFLAIDEAPLLLEGNWDYSKSVIIKFESKKDFEAWYYSAGYQKILKYRLNAAKCDTILVEGVE